MNTHALLKINELEKYPGISLSENYDFLFFKAKAFYRLNKFHEALKCCYDLKALSKKPNESLDVAILNLEAKVQQEIQNDMSDKYYVGRTQTRDRSVPRISNLVSDIIPKNLSSSKKVTFEMETELLLESFPKPQKSFLELFSSAEESNGSSVDLQNQRSSTSHKKNNDGITRLKELADKGVIKPPKYVEISSNPFAIKCIVYFGPKLFETTNKIASKKKEAKHFAANAMINELKIAKII